MLKIVRAKLIDHLWKTYRRQAIEMQEIECILSSKNINAIHRDHFAVIDLPSRQTGISQLAQIFSAIGYLSQGRDYLPEKQNEFLWMTENDSFNSNISDVLPKVVVADFWLDAMPKNIQSIILKYTDQSPPSPVSIIQNLSGRIYLGDASAIEPMMAILIRYFKGRDWPLPTVNEFQTIFEFNELLAWVLVFGRCPNHFGLSIYLMSAFTELSHFNDCIQNNGTLKLNQEGGIIKGHAKTKIAQSATAGIKQTIHLSDGTIEIAPHFVEFVWRYPGVEQPRYFQDYFTGFIGKQANNVIESLFTA